MFGDIWDFQFGQAFVCFGVNVDIERTKKVVTSFMKALSKDLIFTNVKPRLSY